MHIWVLYADAGSGHRMAAQALAQALLKQNPACRVECRDVLADCRPFFRSLYPRVYRFLVAHAPGLWGLFFRLTHEGMRFHIFRCLRRRFNAYQTAGFIRLLLKESPDQVVATHFLPIDIISGLKAAGRFSGQLAAVITDFGVHRFWIDERVDWYAVGSQRARTDVSCAVRADIRISGIPVREEFTARPRKRYEEENPSGPLRVLVASGGLGVGPIERVTHTLTVLKPYVYVDVICGHNTALYKCLLSRAREWDGADHLRIFGFVKDVHALMREADLVVSKPGGVTISECLAVGVPLISIAPIPGQEEMNTAWLKDEGIACPIRSAAEIAPILRRFQDHPRELHALCRKVLEKGRPEASRDIAQELLRRGKL